MRFGFDLSQPSTVRGVVLLVFGISALIMFMRGNIEIGGALVSAAITLSGAVGTWTLDHDRNT